MIALAKPVRQIAALAILGVLLLAVWWALVSPLVSATRFKLADLAQKRGEAAHYHWLLDNAQSIDAALADLSRHNSGNLVFDGLTLNQAVAQFQNELAQTIAAAGISLNVSRVLPSEDAGPVTRMRINISFTCGARALKTLFVKLQQMPHLMRFDNVVIRSPGDARSSTSPKLFVQMDAVAFLSGSKEGS